MKALLLRLDAPLMSFGAPCIDHNGVVQTFPALSMLTGLFANALGWDHRDVALHQALQARVRFAARIDRRGEALVDYQTVDLGLDWMQPAKAGWTTAGQVAFRAGGSSEGTHQRYRHYVADSVCTLAVSLAGDGAPTINDVAVALNTPARPLFLGRKCCVPAAPIFLDVVEAADLLAVLANQPRLGRADPGPLRATWFEGESETVVVGEAWTVAVSDERDWRGRVHVGRRFMREGAINPPESTHG